MKLRDCIAGEVMIHVKSGRPVRVAAPRTMRGAAAGVCVYYWHTNGASFVALNDSDLKKATMREQRDFWREAFENLAMEE
jgi:hypothetical protein